MHLVEVRGLTCLVWGGEAKTVLNSCACAQKPVEDGSGFLNEEEGEGDNGRRQMRPLSGCSPASLEGTEDCIINARVVGNSLQIHHWSTLWSQVSI